MRAQVGLAARLSPSATETASRLSAFGLAVNNVRVVLRRAVTDVVVLDTTITVAPGQTLTLALPVTITQLDERFVARIELRQDTTVLYSGEHNVTASVDGSSSAPPPVVITVDYTGPGASAAQIRIAPRDSVFPTTARPRFSIMATDSTGAAVTGVPVLWSTSDTALATVDADGALTPGNRRGAVTLTARTLNDLSDALPVTLLSPAATLGVAGGAGQTGAAGSTLPESLVVEVLAADGLPAAGETVRFAAPAGGAVGTADVLTGLDGRAATTVTLAPSLGAQLFTVTVGTMTPLTITQHAVAGVPAKITALTDTVLAGTVGQPLATPLTVMVKDSLGLPVAGATVAWTLGTGGGALGAATSVTASDGTAGVHFTPGTVAGAATITASVDAISMSFAVTVAADSAASLVATAGDGQRAPPATALAPLAVQLSDRHGNRISGAIVSWARPGGSGTLGVSSSITDSAGVASAGYTTGLTAGVDTVVATAGALEARFTLVTEAGAPAKLTKVAGDAQTVVAGLAVPLRPAAQVSDASGNAVAATVDVTVSGPGIATPLTVNVATDAAGVISLPDTLLQRPRQAGEYAVAMQLAGVPAAAVTFTLTVVPAPASVLTVVAAPSSATSGLLLAPQPVLQLADSLGNLVKQAGVTVTAAAGSGAALSGTPAISTDASGVASYSDLAISGPAGAVSLTFSAAGMSAAAVDVALGVGAPSAGATTLAIGATTLSAGDTTTITVTVRDSTGNVITTATPADVAVTADAGTLGTPICTAGICTGTYTAPSTADTVTIKATIGGVQVQHSPASITVTAGAASAATSTLALDDSSLVVNDTTTVRVTVKDAGGNAVLTAVPTDFVLHADTGSFGPVACVGGICTATYTAPSTAGPASIKAMIGGVAIVNSPATIAVMAGAPSAATSTMFVADTAVTVGDTISVTVMVMDDTENLVTTATPADVTLAATLGSFGAATCSAGVCTAIYNAPATAGTDTISARVGGAHVQGSPAPLAIVGTAPGAPSAAASTLAVAATAVLVNGTTAVTVVVRDSAGATVTSAAPGDVTMAASSGSLDSLACSDGTCTATFTAPSTPDSSTISARLGGVHVAGSPAVVTSVAEAATVAGVTLTPPGDTLTSLGDAVLITATAFDTAGTPAPGSFTWTSRDPSKVAVDSTGLVTSVANGSAWVVATESGGAADSALIVVQQRVASVVVTPGSIEVYRTGIQPFSAAAVDGRGNAIGAPAFTWSSTIPSVASVDTAGVVTGLSLGSTQIKATSDGITGVASLTVLTPITRISVGAVSGDTVVADTTALTAIGMTRALHAVAFDTLGTPMTGVVFTWASSNASVAPIELSDTTSAVAEAAANGTTTISASADGVMGGTAVRVRQVLAGIQLTPSVATIAPSGTVGLLARGVDANGFYISGGSFTFTSGAPGIATVSSTSGVVTGVATGTASVTAASGGIVSEPAAISVSYEVPPVISFGRDTLSVGRGSTMSIPVYLSRPSDGAVTVTLAVADTFAYFSSASVTFPGGVTAANATLNGRNAGMTRIFATDGSGTGFAGDTAALAVTATVRLASTGFWMNATDSRQTQVLLSDPSPEGGTYVSLPVAISDAATVSPNPAFIPAGQLAADVVITGTSTSSSNVTTTITPSAIGVDGTSSSVTVYPANMSFSTSTYRLGAGQFEPHIYVRVPTTSSAPIPVTLTSSAPGVLSVQSSTTIPAGSYYAYFTLTGYEPGTATVTLSSPGWTATNSLTTTVTSPKVAVCCGAFLNTTSPVRSVTVYSQDSAGVNRRRTNSLVVRLASSDTNVMKVLDTTVTIAAGQSSTSAGRVVPGGTAGSAYLRALVDGHYADSVLFTVTGPKLSWSSSLRRLGAGQYDNAAYVATPNSVVEPLTIRITSTESSVVSVTDTLVIPAGGYYVYPAVRAHTPGTVSLIVEAAGYSPDTITYVSTTPRVEFASAAVTVNDFSPPQSLYVEAADSVGANHYRSDSLQVTLYSTDTSVVKVDSVVTIGAGASYSSSATVTIVGVGTASVIAGGPAHRGDTIVYTVKTPKLSLSRNSYTIGARQYRGPSDFYVSTPNSRTSDLAVSFTQLNPAVVGMTADSLVVTAGSNASYFGISGLAAGVDTVIASAPGYLPDTMPVRVTTPQLKQWSIPTSLTTTSPPFDATVYAADSLLASHYALDTITIRVTSTDTTVLKPAQEYVHLPRGAYYAHARINVVGPGTASLIFADSAGVYVPDTTNATTVTGPSLTFSRTSTKLGMRQTTGGGYIYVHTPHAVTDTLTVNLASTDIRVATVPASVRIPAGLSYAHFPIDAQDTLGTIQVQATATGYNAASTSVQVTEAKFVISTTSSSYTTGTPRTIYVQAADADGTVHYTREDVTVTLASSAPGVAGVDSSVVTIPAGAYYSNAARWEPVAVGTAQLSASDPRAGLYRYGAATFNVAVSDPKASFSFNSITIGLGQYADNSYHVSTPDYQKQATTVALSHLGAAAASIPPAVTIDSASYYAYFRIAGSVVGADTIQATISSPFHRPDTAVVTVGKGRIDGLGGWPSALNVGESALVTIYVRDPASTIRRVLAATTYTLTPSEHLEFIVGDTVVTSVTVPADGDRVTVYVRAKSAGTGTATFSAPDYVTHSNSVTVNP